MVVTAIRVADGAPGGGAGGLCRAYALTVFRAVTVLWLCAIRVADGVGRAAAAAGRDGEQDAVAPAADEQDEIFNHRGPGSNLSWLAARHPDPDPPWVAVVVVVLTFTVAVDGGGGGGGGGSSLAAPHHAPCCSLSPTLARMAVKRSSLAKAPRACFQVSRGLKRNVLPRLLSRNRTS